MEDEFISGLPAGTTVTGTEEIPADQGTSTVHLTPVQITTFAASETKVISNKTIDLSDNTIIATESELNAIVSPNLFTFANPRVYSDNYDSTLNVNLDAYDCYELFAITGNVAISAPLGGFSNFRKIAFRFYGTSSYTLTWDIAFIDGIVLLPISTIANEWLYVYAEYNDNLNGFECVYVNSSSGGTYTGTANRISVTGSVIDIDAAYVGQSSIVTVGTLTSGSTGSGFTLNFGSSTQSGVIGSNNGGAGAVSGLLKSDGAGNVSAAIPGVDYIGMFFKDTVTSTSTSGTTNTMLMSSHFSPTDFATGNIIELIGRVVKTGINNIGTMRYYYNTTNSLSGATLLGTLASTIGSQLFFAKTQVIKVKSSTLLEVLNPTISTSSDESNLAVGTISDLSISVGSGGYFMMAYQCTSGSDSAAGHIFIVKKY